MQQYSSGFNGAPAPYQQPYYVPPQTPQQAEKARLRRDGNFAGGILLTVTVSLNVLPLLIIRLLLAFGVLSRQQIGMENYGLGNTGYVLLYGALYAASMALPVVVLAVCCGRRHFPLSPAARVNAGDAFFGVLAAMGICVLANFVASYILAYLSQFGIEAPASPELLVHTPESLLYNILVIAVLPALLEEMVFRGYLLRAMRPYGDWFAVGFSALCFGLMHANIAQIPFAVIVGVALGWLYVMTDNIWLPVAVHFCNNAMSVLLDYLSTGMSQQVTSLYYLLVMLAVLLIGAVCMGILLVRRSALFRRLPSRSCLSGGARFGITLTAPVMLLSVIVLVVETIWKTVR